MDATKNFVKKRRHWFKAFEIISQLACLAYETIERDQYRKNLLTFIPKTELIDKNNKKAADEAAEAREEKVRAIDEKVESFVVPENELHIFKH